MNEFAPHPWYCTADTVGMSIRDRDGRRIADVTPIPDDREAVATARLLRLAPNLLITLRFAIGILHQAGDHRELCAHMQRVVDKAEPEDAIARFVRRANSRQEVA